MVWPSLFTNVTDSYRLSRGGRLRTDLGGLYFNLVFMLVLAGLYWGTSAEIVLLVIAVTHLEMLEQLVPFVRFDGYFIVSDLAGVPDLFGRIRPILRSALQAGRRDLRTASLRRSTRTVVIGWMLGVIPLVTVTGGYLLLHLPAIDRELWRAVSRQGRLAAVGFVHHQLRGRCARRRRTRAGGPACSRLVLPRCRDGAARYGSRPAMVGRPPRPAPARIRGRSRLRGVTRRLLGYAGPVPRLVAVLSMISSGRAANVPSAATPVLKISPLQVSRSAYYVSGSNGPSSEKPSIDSTFA